MKAMNNYKGKNFSSTWFDSPFLLLPLLFFLLLVEKSQAQEQALDSYLEMALENNPKVMSAFDAYKAQLAKVDQMGQLPDAELGIGYFLRPMQLLMGNQVGEVSLMQMFPWFGTLRTEKAEATHMAEASYEAFREQSNQVLFEVKNTYYDLLLLQHTMDVTESNLKLLETLEALSLIRFQGGDSGGAVGNAMEAVSAPSLSRQVSPSGGMQMGGGSASTTRSKAPSDMNSMGEARRASRMTDVLRLQVQIKGVKSDLEQLQQDKAPLIQRFVQLSGLPEGDTIELEWEDATPAFKLEEMMLDSIWEHNPMLSMLYKEADALLSKAQLAELAGKPMIGLGLNYMLLNSRPEMGMPGGSGSMEYMPPGMGGNMFMPMLTLSLPFSRKKYKGMVTEARNLQTANRHTQENLKNELKTELAEVINSLNDASRRAKLLEEQVELLEKTMELMIVAYANAEGSFEELIAIQRELLDYRLSQIDATISSLRAQARWELLVGM
jgi:outer membrane protein TolC